MRPILLGALLVARLAGAQPATREWIVRPGDSLTSLTAVLRTARDGDRIVVRAGTYREPTLLVRQRVSITGEPGAILDGEGVRAIMLVEADSVVIRGLAFRHTGASQVEDRAALKVRDARGCVIDGNTFDDTFFGIYLQRVRDCTVRGNRLASTVERQTLGGNGIQLWQSDSIRVAGNHVRGHRDGIYFEFVTHGDVRDNVSERNQRYGLHFMFSDDCVYAGNTFRENESGVAVMYTRRVHMTGNTFADNRGSAAYGLLLKDISDSEVRGNQFLRNTVGLYLEGANRNVVDDNTFASNGWALRLLANAQDNQVTSNAFTSNAFDVGTNSRQNFSTFRGNYWDRYRGYDLDRDGFGDVPHAPVRLFALVVEQTPAAIILLRSTMVDLLDFAERVLPMLTPQTLVDEKPRISAERRVTARTPGRLPPDAPLPR